MKIAHEHEKTMVRFSQLEPGAVFDACGDPAIKCADGDAVVLRDGNYVHREPSDVVELLDAEVVIH